jgi:hypothetical protein
MSTLIPRNSYGADPTDISLSTATSSAPDTTTPTRTTSSSTISTASGILAPNAGSSSNTVCTEVSTGVSTGALAGGIVGAAIGGALIAFFLTFQIMSSRRHGRRHRRSSSRSAHHNGDAPSPEKSTPLVDRRHAWELHLPQPTDDATLRKAMKTLYDRIELHIENFYSDLQVYPAAHEEAKWSTAIQQVDSPYLPAPIGTLLQQTKRMTAVMKHSLAHLVISGIDVNANCPFPLLPDEVTATPHAAAKSSVNKPGSLPLIFLPRFPSLCLIYI